MGRGVSSGGGRSSLDYLFGSGEAPKQPAPAEAPPVQKLAPPPPADPSKQIPAPPPPADPSKQIPAPPPPADATKQIPAGIQGSQANNYFRADGQNAGNFITERPSTKVHAAPGGGSSLGYLFGGN